jgi:hypothetical protein
VRGEKRVKLYLETSVPNMLFSAYVLDKREITERLFSLIQAGAHKAVVSALYIDEIRETPSILLRYQLEGIIKLYGAEVIDVTEDAERLAEEYVNVEAFTENSYFDALHVSTAVCGGCDVVVSWNFRHIARAWTIKKVAEVNRRLGLPEIVICTPEEVVGDA